MLPPLTSSPSPSLDSPPELPISQFRDEIVAAIIASPVVIIAGEPGSGKTTQIPKFCLLAGRGGDKKIGCTQPRRIAAISMAARLQEELGPAGAAMVGHRIRFSDQTSRGTRIKFMTDGILLAEVQRDRELRAYDTIIVDEAHERSLNIDFLLGILKNLLQTRSDLKVIITSATIDTEKFSRHFNRAPVIKVAGRTHPVEIRYRPVEEETNTPAAESEPSYVEQAAAMVGEIMEGEGAGDILLFMPTERDIRECAEILEQQMPSASSLKSGAASGSRRGGGLRGGVRVGVGSAVIMPLYGRLSPGEQRRIFQPVKGRKIVIATNVAETSITVPGIRYVVDTGLARIAAYNPRARTHKLPVVPIARSACDQRAGRCGRVGPGVCYRLYSEENYLNRTLYTPPEIVRSNLAEVILRMISLKLGDPAGFPFVDPPSSRAIRDGYQLLLELGALESGQRGGGAAELTGPGMGPLRLTRQGRVMSRLPLDPCISRMILEARDHNALREVSVIAAALSIQDPRIRPLEREKEADLAHRRFVAGQSDFLFYLKLWETSREVLSKTGSIGKLRKFCAGHFLYYQRMREWQDIHQQIARILAEEQGFTFNTLPAEPEAVHRALLSGNLRNIAIKKEKNRYQGGGGREILIFPGSTLYQRRSPIEQKEGEESREKKGGGENQSLPRWIMAAELVETSKLYARTVAAIEPEWIEPLAKPLMRYNYGEPHWEKRRGQVVALERGTLFGLTVVAGRKVAYARIDAEGARHIFIQSALVEGELRGNYPFLEHNQALIARLQDMEERSRRRDLLVDEQEIFNFYQQRLPPEVVDQSSLNRLLKIKKAETSGHGERVADKRVSGDDFLRLREEELVSREPESDLTEKFPATLLLGETPLELRYHFEPGADDDGLSVLVPLSLAPHLRPELFEWLVPGMLPEKIFFLLKNLPKNLRRRLVPIPQTSEVLAQVLKPGNYSLCQALAKRIHEMYGLRIEAEAWPMAELPPHLRCRFCLMDEQGSIVAAGRQLDQLVAEGGTIGSRLPSGEVEKLKGRWERERITASTLPQLPEHLAERLAVVAENGRLCGYLFPGLEERGEQVDLRLFTDEEEAGRATIRGLLRLYRREFAPGMKMLDKELSFPKRHWRLLQGLGDTNELNRRMAEFTLRELFAVGSGKIPSAQEFKARVAKVTELGLFNEARRLFSLPLEVLSRRGEVLSALTRLQPSASSLLPKGKGEKKSGAFAELGALVSAKTTAELDGGAGGSTSPAAALRAQLDALVPADFPSRYDADGMARLPRYLKGLRIRIERAHADPAKDQAKAALLAPFEQRLAKYPDPSQLSQAKKTLLAEYNLMLEEYKVSLFAQELKTLFPISPQRLEEKWQELEGTL